MHEPRRGACQVPALDLPDTDEVLTDILQSPSPSSRVRRQFLESVKKEYDSSSSRLSVEVRIYAQTFAKIVNCVKHQLIFLDLANSSK